MRRGSILSRIAGAGMAAALLGLLVWPFAGRSDLFFWLLAVFAGLTALAGFTILLLTGVDLVLKPRRGARVAPIRIFDIVCGTALLALAYLQLDWLAGQLPA